jgi:hypothetical protein
VKNGVLFIPEGGEGIDLGQCTFGGDMVSYVMIFTEGEQWPAPGTIGKLVVFRPGKAEAMEFRMVVNEVLAWSHTTSILFERIG